MEYLISILITLLFITIYIASRPTERERFIQSLNDSDFLSALNNSAKSENLPRKTGKKEYTVTKYLRKIKFVNFLCKRKISKKMPLDSFFCNELSFFHQMIEGNSSILKDLQKTDFSKLQNLPSYDNCLRIEKMCKIILENSNFQFSENRISTTLHVFNSISTITFAEIQNFQLIAKFLLIEKLYFVAIRIHNLIKAEKFAKKVVAHPNFYKNKKFYQQVKTNNIFLHFTSTMQNLDCPSADLVFLDVIENINDLTHKIFDGIKFVDSYDFSKFYTPLKFLGKYVNFQNSTSKTKSAFLTELSNQSSKLNIDELAYTYSLAKFFDRADILSFKSTQAKILGKFLNITTFKSNMKTLSIALKSPITMDLIFNPNKQKFKRV